MGVYSEAGLGKAGGYGVWGQALRQTATQPAHQAGPQRLGAWNFTQTTPYQRRDVALDGKHAEHTSGRQEPLLATTSVPATVTRLVLMSCGSGGPMAAIIWKQSGQPCLKSPPSNLEGCGAT